MLDFFLRLGLESRSHQSPVIMEPLTTPNPSKLERTNTENRKARAEFCCPWSTQYRPMR